MADVLFACAALRVLVCSGSVMKRAFPGEQQSWGGELWNQGIKDGGHLQQMSEAHCPEEGFGFACFKILGQEGYHFFHRRFPGGDYWEVYAQKYKRLRRLRRL